MSHTQEYKKVIENVRYRETNLPGHKSVCKHHDKAEYWYEEEDTVSANWPPIQQKRLVLWKVEWDEISVNL